MNVTFLQADNADEDICRESGTFCCVCGSPMYITDHGSHVITFHCSSREAKFWNFQECALEQLLARRHWERSRRELLMDVGEAMDFVRESERLVPEKSFFKRSTGGASGQESDRWRDWNPKKSDLVASAH